MCFEVRIPGKTLDDCHGKIISNSDWSKTGDNSKNVSIIKPTRLLRHQHISFIYQGTESDIYVLFLRIPKLYSI